MQEIMLEEQMSAQLRISEQPVGLQQPAVNQLRQNRPRKPKKPQSKTPEATIEETINSLKNEIEYMPMKTPISILQELLSRRGNFDDFSPQQKILIFFFQYY